MTMWADACGKYNVHMGDFALLITKYISRIRYVKPNILLTLCNTRRSYHKVCVLCCGKMIDDAPGNNYTTTIICPKHLCGKLFYKEDVMFKLGLHNSLM
jgi:hypothetical protein